MAKEFKTIEELVELLESRNVRTGPDVRVSLYATATESPIPLGRRRGNYRLSPYILR